MKLDKNMKRVLNFATKYPGLHTFAKDRPTVNAITKLAKLGLIKINNYHQFSLVK